MRPHPPALLFDFGQIPPNCLAKPAAGWVASPFNSGNRPRHPAPDRFPVETTEPDILHHPMKTLLTIIAAASLVSSVSLGADKKYKEGSCCDKAAKKGEACKHPCCVAAEKEGKVCEKCNK